jgi:hypothetical protein
MREVEKKDVTSSVFSASPFPPCRVGSGVSSPALLRMEKDALQDLVYVLAFVVAVALTFAAIYVAATS